MSAFEDCPQVVTIPEVQTPHRRIMPSSDSGPEVVVVSSLQ